MSGRLVPLVVGLALFCPTLRAQTFTVGSQNTLHYGWGSTNPTRPSSFDSRKVTAIWYGVISGKGVGLLQEVMPRADMSKFTCKLGQCVTHVSPEYGRGWYREMYVTFVTDPLTKWNQVKLECSEVMKNCAFSRPPLTVQFTTPDGGTVGVANFHAIWGDSKSLRVAEAAQIKALRDCINKGTASNCKKNYNIARFVVGGDWNLTADEVKAEIGDCGMTACVGPAGRTTLNPAGAPSSSYDHFYWTSAFTASDLKVLYPSIGYPNWRLVVSDHLGVSGTFKY